MDKTFIGFLIFFCLHISSLKAHEIINPYAQKWDGNSGLTSEQVYSIAEDHMSRIWIGTPNGVNIIDGIGVTKLLSDKDVPTSIRSNLITNIIPFEKQMLVLGLHGIDIVDPISLTTTPVSDPNSFLTRAKHIGFLDDSDSLIVAGRKLVRWNINTNKISPLSIEDKTGDIFGIQVLSNDKVLLTAEQGVFWFEPNNEELELYIGVGDGNLYNDIRYTFIDSENRLWLSIYGKGIYIFENSSISHHVHEGNSDISSNLISHIFEAKGKIYVVTRKGIEVFLSNSAKHVQTIKPESEDDSFMESDMALTGFYSKSGDLLIGTTSGFFKIDTKDKPFSALSDFIGKEKNNWSSIRTENGRFLLRGNSEIYEITGGDLRQLEITKLQSFPSDENMISHSGGLLLYENNRIVRQDREYTQIELQGLPNNIQIISIFKGLDDDYYLVSNEQVYLARLESKVLTILAQHHVGPILVADMLVADNVLYVASQRGGLLKLNMEDLGREYVKFIQVPGPAVPIALMQDQRGRIWVLTMEGSVFFKKNQLSDFQLFKQSGRNFKAVCVVEDLQGNLVFATHEGLSIWNSELVRLKGFSKEDGLHYTDFKRHECGSTEKLIYFLTGSDVYLFNKKIHREIHTKPQLFLSHVQEGLTFFSPLDEMHFIEPSLLKFRLYSPDISLDKSFNIYYRFINQHKTNIEDWNQSTSNEIFLIQPSVGNYILEVKLKRFDGLEGEPVALKFSIDKPFYQSTLMIMIYFLLILAVVSLIFSYQIRLNKSKLRLSKIREEKQQQYNKLLEKEVSEKTLQYKEQQQKAVKANIDKTRFITSASHDLRVPINAIRWKLESMNITEVNQKKAIMEELVYLDKLVESIVNLSRFDAKMIEASLIEFSIVKLVEELIARFKSGLQMKSIKLKVIHSLKNKSIHVYTDRFLLSRLINNLMDNAIKNLSPQGQIKIILEELQDNKIRFKIEDNGKGIPEHCRNIIFNSFVRGTNTYVGTGLGLTIVQQIAEVLKLNLVLETCDYGTSFSFELSLAENVQDSEQIFENKDKILIIDDDLFYANKAGNSLKGIGYEVKIVEDISSSLLKKNFGKYKAIICDYNLGISINGIQLVNHLTSHKQLIVDMVIISSEDALLRQEVKNYNNWFFLSKPFRLGKLSWLLQQVGGV